MNEALAQNKFFKAWRITERVTRITGLAMECCYLIEGEERALLIDGLTGVGSLRAFVRELTELPVTVALTHAHMDHSGIAWESDSVYLHPDDLFLLYRNCWGYADKAAKTTIQENSIFRMMSMTKCVTAVGILQLMEAGKLNLDDPLSLFIPSFAEPRVAADARYRWHDGMKMGELLQKTLFFQMERVKTVPAEREITIRDLLSHSSGLEQGMVGLLAMLKDRQERVDLAAQAERYAGYPLDFQPGCGTGYSPLAGFDVLARVIEVVSGTDAVQYYKANIFQPLGMRDTAFHLNEEQKKRLVHIYCRKNGRLMDVTGSKEDLPKKFHFGERYICGAGGLYAALDDYGAFAEMLQNGGSYHGVQILKPETVQLMRTEAPLKHMEPEPGFVWGLGVKIRQDPVRGGSAATKGTYGWSGAFGTHFFVSPADELSCVLMLNRSDLDGAGSYISKKVEELVFGTFAGKGEQS